MRINHIAIATRNRQRLVDIFKAILNTDATPRLAQPDHGVYTTFIPTATSTKIEILEEHGSLSPISRFLDTNPSGGVHHVCVEVESVAEAAKRAEECGVRVLGEVKIGAHGKPVLFLHPKDTGGVLIELEQQ